MVVLTLFMPALWALSHDPQSASATAAAASTMILKGDARLGVLIVIAGI
jgi:hypothetical protein